GRALRVLAGGAVPGAVRALGVAPAPRSAPPVGEPVLAHVRARRPQADALLAGLLGPAVAAEGGWPEAVDAVLAHPDAVVVARAGGRLSAGGRRPPTAPSGPTGRAHPRPGPAPRGRRPAGRPARPGGRRRGRVARGRRRRAAPPRRRRGDPGGGPVQRRWLAGLHAHHRNHRRRARRGPGPGRRGR